MIAFAHVVAQCIAVEAVDGVDRAENRAAHRLTGVSGFEQMIEDKIVGRVERLPDFLNDDTAFAFEFGGVEHRVLQNVGKEVDGERQIALHHAGVIGGRFMRRMRVEMTTDVFDLFSDGARVAALGAFERHMFEQMRDTMLVTGFVTRAGVNPDANRNGLQMRHGIRHYS